MPNVAECYDDPDEVEAQLAQIGEGLTIDLLHNSLKGGHSARENTTRFHPRLHGPFNGYAETTAILRAQLWTHGWTLDDTGNYARIVSPDSRNCIVVSSGDQNTGVRGATDPQTRSPKGLMTQEAVLVNAQLNFLQDLGVETAPARGNPGHQRTWILLVSDADGEIRAEVSSPSHFEDGRPEQYTKRLLLPAYLLGDGSDDRPESGDDFEIDVTRRKA